MRYLPERGDIVMMDFNPSKGHGQGGRRPALIISPSSFNKFNICYAMPITSKLKGYHTEVILHSRNKTRGAVLTNHMKALDWTLRNIEFIEFSDTELLDEIDIRLRTILML